ncbi:MAG TPA: chemotaxis protein CheA [Aromatoleum sp.]|uniref:chemotaxis protein CheA n=1 Tax=Aromatoleum sp. TaxID=2307007 RepID=UPI002B49A6ED|nr:chemotaxis protein CheA [Aromatoleum sp.]HJV25006.1 chemotaxis protein CheA [Aromatoleum sp.]
MNFDQALDTFVAEAGELLRDMEEALLRLEGAPTNEALIHAMFRAAHTIKGSAGLFGLEPIVAFTHVLEHVLDKLRTREIAVCGELIAVLLPCGDHIGKLVAHVPAMALDEETRACGERLMASLRGFLGKPAIAAAAVSREGLKPGVGSAPEHGHGEAVTTDNWHISLRFDRDVLRNGMDPLSFIRYLATVGEVVSITTLSDAMPEGAAMDPESCYLGFEIELRSGASKETIEDVFEFVREDSEIHVLPPHSKVSEYVELIRRGPEDDLRLGEILVASGALTRRELEAGLDWQNALAAGPVTGPLGELLVEQKVVAPQVVQSALDKQLRSRTNKVAEHKLVRVPADKLDSLINLVGELVIAGAGANLLAQQRRDGAMLEATTRISSLVEEIRDGALRLRMVQIGETFNRFQRVVRDVGKELGKDIELVIGGAETELDKSVVEGITDPLTHLVRNAIDHGIESAEIRTGRGKRARGTLRLNACHDSGCIVIEVSDDGSGLNKERIVAKAVGRGLVQAGQSLAEHEIHDLIFEPGFSTAEQLSNLSGRGVGMDVVRQNIEALRGTVELESTEGQGTTVRIRLPLTLAIIDGFLVGVGDAAYVVPLDMVLECVELSDADRRAATGRAYINLRGEVLPFLRLRDRFGLSGYGGHRESIVVVRYGVHKAGLVVDELMGEFQTVIKPLGKVFSRVRGIGGSTILGSGQVALILDVPSLLQEAAARDAGGGAAGRLLTTTA